MEVVTIQSEAFQSLISKIDELKQCFIAEKKQPKEKWLDNQELMQLLHISKRTAQHYRDSGIIAFSQVGNKLYYKLADVEQLLQTHYNKQFSKKYIAR